MRKILLVAGLLLVASTASAQVYVQGHYTANGTYVQGYERSAPNNTKIDNYSTQGNTNPYTGQQGTVNPYVTPAYTSPSTQSSYGNVQDNTQTQSSYGH